MSSKMSSSVRGGIGFGIGTLIAACLAFWDSTSLD